MNSQTKTLALDRWRLPLRNDAGEDIPAFACVKVSADTGGPGAELFYGATQAALGAETQCVFVGPVIIPDGGYGAGTDLPTAVALYDAAGGADPVDGDEWGPNASYALKRTGKGFIIIGGVDSDTTTVHVLRKGGGASATNFRAIRGRVTADVSADDTSFDIDNIVLLAGSDDPRISPGDSSEHVTVASLLNESFPAGTNVTAIYSPAVDTDIDWELIVVERYRALRGTVYSQSGATLTVDHIVPLDHGDDPRVDTTDVTETVSVEVLNGDTFTSEDKVWADYNASLDQWEARPKGGGSSSGVRFGRVTEAISPATGAASSLWGSGKIKVQDPTTGSIDTVESDVWNLWIGIGFVVDAQVTVETGSFVVLEGTCEAVDWGD